MWKFDDRNGDKVIDDSDMSVIGNANPDFYGGLNNQFKYKGWDFNFFFTFSYGGEVLNATKLTNTKTATTNYSVLNIANSSNRWMTVNSEGQLITDPEEMAAINAEEPLHAYMIWKQATNTSIHGQWRMPRTCV